MEVYMSVETSAPVVEIVSRFDIGFGDMPLVFFNRKNEMGFHDVVADSAQALHAIGGELSNRLGDFDMSTRNIHFH